jgi:hypothetical protein
MEGDAMPNPWSQLAGIKESFRTIHAELADGILREKTRKARRMTLLLSLVGIVWCKGIVVTKESIGGFEIQGLVPMIPYIIAMLLFFFFIQFLFYESVDRRRALYLFSEVQRLNSDFRGISIGSLNATGQSAMRADLEEIISNANQLMTNTRKLLRWDRSTLYWVFAIAVVAFVGRYAFGWFLQPAPLIPHIPDWAPLWQ